MQVCGQTEPGPQAIPHLQQSNAIEWGRPVSGSSDSEVRRLRRLPRYVHVDSAVIRKIAAATKLRPTRPQWVCGAPELPRGLTGYWVGGTGLRDEHFKAVVKQQQNCQFKWHLRPGFQLTAGQAPPAHGAPILRPLTPSIYLPERSEQRVFFTPGKTSTGRMGTGKDSPKYKALHDAKVQGAFRQKNTNKKQGAEIIS